MTIRLNYCLINHLSIRIVFNILILIAAKKEMPELGIQMQNL